MHLQPKLSQSRVELDVQVDRLIVDDVANTGHSVTQTVSAIEAAGGTVAGIACYVDRGNITAADLGGFPYQYLMQWKIPSWSEAETPAEVLARPVNTRYAHGAEYVARKLAAARS